MNTTRKKIFHYIKLGNENDRYYCVQQTLGMVAWILFFKKTILRPIDRNGAKTHSLKIDLNWARRHYGFFKRNIRILLHFAFYHKLSSGMEFLLKLPCFGHLCVPVHRGYKIFDLRRAVAIKVFDHDVHPTAIESEIELLQRISPIDFAPSIRKWNIAERWYEENYLPGVPDGSSKPMDTETLLTRFHHDVVHKLKALILFQEPQLRKITTYVDDITQIIYSSRLSKQESTVREFQGITNFINIISDRLRIADENSIFLMFTHGDFVPANMLNTSHGMKIVDWESAGRRSALFDFYCYFFYRSANRAVPVNTLWVELKEAFPLLMVEIAKKEQNISQTIECAEHIYRWIFYIEMLCRLVEREMSDKNLNVKKFISLYLDAFVAYEELLGWNHVSQKLGTLSSLHPHVPLTG